jgi:hypothetical protein
MAIKFDNPEILRNYLIDSDPQFMPYINSSIITNLLHYDMKFINVVLEYFTKKTPHIPVITQYSYGYPDNNVVFYNDYIEKNKLTLKKIVGNCPKPIDVTPVTNRNDQYLAAILFPLTGGLLIYGVFRGYTKCKEKYQEYKHYTAARSSPFGGQKRDYTTVTKSLDQSHRSVTTTMSTGLRVSDVKPMMKRPIFFPVPIRSSHSHRVLRMVTRLFTKLI